MKIAFWFGALVGCGGLLAAAHFLPWMSHTRLPSQTTVVANGGRAEQFMIRLPADRIAVSDGPSAGLRAAAADATMLLPAKFMNEPLLLEHFKVRDSAGNVIGVAARHWVAAGAGASTTWTLSIPSRGALLLSAPGEQGGVVESALGRAGLSHGADWNGEVRIELGKDGVVTAGTAEFSGLSGSYTEEWTLTGVDASGELRGTIAIDTVTHRAP